MLTSGYFYNPRQFRAWIAPVIDMYQYFSNSRFRDLVEKWNLDSVTRVQLEAKLIGRVCCAGWVD
jgi:hypothetical protein